MGDRICFVGFCRCGAMQSAMTTSVLDSVGGGTIVREALNAWRHAGQRLAFVPLPDVRSGDFDCRCPLAGIRPMVVPYPMGALPYLRGTYMTDPTPRWVRTEDKTSIPMCRVVRFRWRVIRADDGKAIKTLEFVADVDGLKEPQIVFVAANSRESRDFAGWFDESIDNPAVLPMNQSGLRKQTIDVADYRAERQAQNGQTKQ